MKPENPKCIYCNKEVSISCECTTQKKKEIWDIGLRRRKAKEKREKNATKNK